MKTNKDNYRADADRLHSESITQGRIIQNLRELCASRDRANEALRREVEGLKVRNEHLAECEELIETKDRTIRGLTANAVDKVDTINDVIATLERGLSHLENAKGFALSDGPKKVTSTKVWGCLTLTQEAFEEAILDLNNELGRFE